MLETPFSHKELCKCFRFALDLLRARLLPTAEILPFRASDATH